MLEFSVGSTVTLTFPFVDTSGEPVVPTEISYLIKDERGDELVELATLAFDPGDTEINVVVDSALNALPAGVPFGIRIVELTLAVGAEEYNFSTRYLVKAAATFIVPSNSFQTYEEALLVAMTMPNALGWDGATEAVRMNGLREAYLRLTRFGFAIRHFSDDTPFPETSIGSIGAEPDRVIRPQTWSWMTPEQFLELPARFRGALCRAQVAECNEILRGDRLAERRRSGLLSETIGESSMMFRSGKPLDRGISSEAMRYLSGYIESRLSIARA